MRRSGHARARVLLLPANPALVRARADAGSAAEGPKRTLMMTPTLTTMPTEPLFLLLLLVVIVLAVAARKRTQPWPRRAPGERERERERDRTGE